MIRVPLSSLLHGAHSKGYAMDNERLTALTDAYLTQEVEIWPKKQYKKNQLKSIMESPETTAAAATTDLPTPQKISRKRQISDTSTPSPKKKKQKEKEKPSAAQPVIKIASEPEPDVWTWTVTAEGLKPVNHKNSFAAFNARMAERQKQIEEQEREDEFHYWSTHQSALDIGSLYDSSDSILSSSQPEEAEVDMHCHELLDNIPELIL